MSETQIILQRNELLTRIMGVGFLLDLIANIVWWNGLVFVSIIFFVGIFVFGISTYLIKKNLFQKGLMYLLITIVWLLITYINVALPDWINLSFLYIIPMVAAIYPNWILIIYSTFISCGTFVYTVLTNGKPLMGNNYESNNLFFYIIIFIIIGFIGAVQQRFSENLRKQSDEKAKEAILSKEETIKTLLKLKGNQEAANDFSEKLNITTSKTLNNSEIVLENFRQMNVALEEQNSQIQNLLTNAREISKQSDHIDQSSDRMKGKSHTSKETMEHASVSFTKLNNGMNKLEEMFNQSLNTTTELNLQTNEIETITKVMEAITEQINLLSLNASIEAARAGIHGKGFSVVADEVRKLAEETRGSTSEIADIISKIKESTKESLKMMEKSKDTLEESRLIGEEVDMAFKNISKNNHDIVSEIVSINEKISKLKISIEGINENIANISSVSEENISSIHETSISFSTIVDAFKEICTDFEELRDKTKI